MALGKNMKVDKLIPLNDLIENKIEKDEEFSFELNLNDDVQIPETEKSSFPEIVLDLTQDSLSSNNEVNDIENKESIKSETYITDDSTITETIPPVSEVPVYENVELENLKIIFTPSRRKTQKRILIAIEGSLTINHVELLYSKVNLVFDYFDFVEVNLNNVTDIDLTVIQLFHAIRVNYWPQQKFISINAEFSRDDRKLLNTCGFTEFQTQVSATV